ncbi:MAG: CinA family protein [Candidatus Omnitrophica bacterium]|nr:CinA family protein [Candidatus Omnitrophota bacterium]
MKRPEKITGTNSLYKKQGAPFTEKGVFGLLAQTKTTLAIAESCTGGRLADTLTNLAGASCFFLGGVIAYHNTIKHRLLRVPRETIAKKGAVSKDVAVYMAAGIRRLLKADIGIAITGIAGPGGGTAKQPVGLVYIAISGIKGCKSHRCIFSGTRTQVKQKATRKALHFLGSYLA